MHDIIIPHVCALIVSNQYIYGRFNCCFKASRDSGVQFNYPVLSKDVGVQFTKSLRDVGVQFNYLMPMSGDLPVLWNIIVIRARWLPNDMHILTMPMSNPCCQGESWLGYSLTYVSYNPACHFCWASLQQTKCDHVFSRPPLNYTQSI